MGPIEQAAERLIAGELVAFPTETVYGLGARADSAVAVAKIYATKGRPSNNPLIVHVLSLGDCEPFAVADARAVDLAEAFWPGPLTLVLPANTPSPITDAVRAGNPSIAVRVPQHPVARALLAATALPIAAPSANKSGQVSPTTANHVRAEFGDRVPVLDGGACEAGLESTILDLTGATPRLLRPGTITRAALAEVLGTDIHIISDPQANPTAPGQLASHYAPRKPVQLNVSDNPLIGFGAVSGPLSLSESGDLAEAGSRLFALLRRADEGLAPLISIAPIPTKGIGRAINDRLRRAAAPR